jgi:hypothetical protein
MDELRHSLPRDGRAAPFIEIRREFGAGAKTPLAERSSGASARVASRPLLRFVPGSSERGGAGARSRARAIIDFVLDSGRL